MKNTKFFISSFFNDSDRIKKIREHVTTVCQINNNNRKLYTVFFSYLNTFWREKFNNNRQINFSLTYALKCVNEGLIYLSALRVPLVMVALTKLT